MKTQIQIDTMSTITGTFFTLTDWSTKTEHNISTEEAITWWHNGLGAKWTARARKYMEDVVLNAESILI